MNGRTLSLALAVSLTTPFFSWAAGPLKNLGEMMLATAGALPTKVAFQYRRAEGWQKITYGEWETRAKKLAGWMLDQGVAKGDRVAIISFNNPSFPLVDLAAQMVGAVLVPMYPSLTGPQHNYILHDASIKILFVMDRTHLEPIRKLAGSLDTVKVVGLLAPADWPKPSREKLKEAGLETMPPEWTPGVTTMDSILAGAEPDQARMTVIRDRLKATGGDDEATICYTSGTTSAPPAEGGLMVYAGKGVILTHTNLLANVESICRAAAIGPSDVFLSILPLAHMFERTCGYYSAVARGATIAYATSPATFADEMGMIKPTIFACVPLLFERMYQKVFALSDKKFVATALKGIENVAGFFGADETKVAAALDVRKMRLLGRLLRHKTGGRLRFAVSGGAALSQQLAEFFYEDSKILILEGYGLTETSPVLTCNRPDAFKFGTVGKVVEGVEVKIAEDGEIIAHGANIMKGYLNQPEETAKAIDAQGWFHSGDLGKFDEEGFLKITGRKKSMFKLATGKYINPEPTENKMVHELVAQTMVCGENQKVAGMMIFPNLEALRTLARAKGITGDDAQLCEHPDLRKVYKAIIDNACAELPDYEKVKVFALLPNLLSVDGGELTPTLKVKRVVVAIKFKAQLDAMFVGQ